METFTLAGMGGDTVLAEAKRRIGDKVCMIGGFNQGHYFSRATEEEVRAAVRQRFQDAGEGGGYILAPSDHFFDADPGSSQAFADEAKKCLYDADRSARRTPMRQTEAYDEFRKNNEPPKWWTPRIERPVLQGLMQRRNLPAILAYGGWLVILGALGYLSALLYQAGSAWCILAFFVYGTIFSMTNSHLHESLHGTPFKTKALNRIMFFISAAMELRATTLTRWRHMHHHAWTIIKGVDLEIQAPRPVRLWKVLIEFLYLDSVLSLIPILVMHSLGVVSSEARKVVPKAEYTKMFWSSRACLARASGGYCAGHRAVQLASCSPVHPAAPLRRVSHVDADPVPAFGAR